LLQHLSVKAFVKRNDFAGTIFCLGGGAGALSHGAEGRFVAQQFDGVTRHRFHVAYIGQEAAHTVLDHFGHSSGAGRNGNNLASHAFEGSQAEGFKFAWHQHHVRDSELLADLILFAQKQHMLVNSFLHRQPLCLRTIGTVADEKQLGWDLLANTIKNLDHIEYALHRTKV